MSALRHPLDLLADKIHERLDGTYPPQAELAFEEVLGRIEEVKDEQAAIAAEHVPGRTYSPEE